MAVLNKNIEKEYRAFLRENIGLVSENLGLF